MPFCPSCGTSLEAENRFCAGCGAQVSSGASAPTATPSAPAPALVDEATGLSALMILQCPSCGGDLEINTLSKSATCAYCNHAVVVRTRLPAVEPARKIENWHRLAKAAIASCEWERAGGLYDRILEEDGEDYNAWYGKVQARWGIVAKEAREQFLNVGSGTYTKIDWTNLYLNTGMKEAIRSCPVELRPGIEEQLSEALVERADGYFADLWVWAKQSAINSRDYQLCTEHGLRLAKPGLSSTDALLLSIKNKQELFGVAAKGAREAALVGWCQIASCSQFCAGLVCVRLGQWIIDDSQGVDAGHDFSPRKKGTVYDELIQAYLFACTLLPSETKFVPPVNPFMWGEMSLWQKKCGTSLSLKGYPSFEIDASKLEPLRGKQFKYGSSAQPAPAKAQKQIAPPPPGKPAKPIAPAQPVKAAQPAVGEEAASEDSGSSKKLGLVLIGGLVVGVLLIGVIAIIVLVFLSQGKKGNPSSGPGAPNTIGTKPSAQGSSKDAQIPEQEIRTFVPNFLASSENSDPSVALSLYGDQVQFFDKGRVSKAYIEKEIVNYRKRWPEVTYKLASEIAISPGQNPGTWNVEYEVDYFVNSPGKDSRSGRSKPSLVLQRIDGNLKIVGSKEKIVRKNP